MKPKSYPKSYLIDKVHNELNYLTREDVTDSINLVLDYLIESLKKEQKIEIRKFGNFSVRKRKYAKNDEFYNTIYYRMPKSLFKD